MSGVALSGGLERPLYEAVRVNCLGNSKMLEMSESRDTCQGELLTGSGTNPRERSVLQSTKLKGVGDLKSVSTSDIKMQSLDFFLAGFLSCFGLVFPHYTPVSTF